MKTITILVGITTLAGLLGSGCGQSENKADTSGAAPEEIAVEEVTIQETVTQAADTAKKAVSDANAKTQELLSQAQKLVGEKKYEEAGSLLQKLANIELTPEQQKTIDNLKATLQKAMQSEAVKEGTKALGNMLGGEK